MKKVKKWIRNKLTKFLGIDDLVQSNTALHNKFNYNNRLLESLEYNNKEIISKNEYILSQFNLAADINPKGYDHSWAIISIQGKPEYVKFVNLSNRDMREVHSFLKRFEGTNRTIDSPMHLFRY